MPRLDFVEIVDAIGVGLDDGLDRGVGRFDGLRCGLGQLLGRDLLAGNEVGQAQGVERGILGELHGASPLISDAAECDGRRSQRKPDVSAQALARASTRLTMSPMMALSSKFFGV